MYYSDFIKHHSLKKGEQNTLIIYCRVSTDIQVEHGHSLMAQEKAGIQKAKNLGMKYEIHVEKGKSAAHDNIDNRPILKAILDRCDEGLVSHIFVTELDRLTRSPVVMYYIKKILVDNSILLHTTSQTINLQDEEQEFFSDLTALLSRRENTIKSKRSKRGLLEAVKKGVWIGIISPFAYKRNEHSILEVDEEEAKVYKLMVQLCLEGNGTNTIAHKLNALEIQTRCKKVLPNGTKVKNKYTGAIRAVKNNEFIWRAGTIYCILTNPIYYGARRYKGQTISSPAIIDVETWSRVQVQLKQNKNSSENHSKKHFYLLKGMLRCGCGANLYGRIKTDERTYMCSSKRYRSCGLRSVNLDKLNNLVWEIVTDNEFQLECLKEEIKSTDVVTKKTLNEKKLHQLEKQILAIDKRKQNLIVLFERSKITIEEFDERNSSLQIEKNELLNELKSIQNELFVLKHQVELLDKNSSDLNVKNTVNTWSDSDKRQFLKRKVKNIQIFWNKNLHEHFVKITFEAGFLITQLLSIESKNAPKAKKDIPKAIPINKLDDLINLHPPTAITPHR